MTMTDVTSVTQEKAQVRFPSPYMIFGFLPKSLFIQIPRTFLHESAVSCLGPYTLWDRMTLQSKRGIFEKTSSNDPQQAFPRPYGSRVSEGGSRSKGRRCSLCAAIEVNGTLLTLLFTTATNKLFVGVMLMSLIVFGNKNESLFSIRTQIINYLQVPRKGAEFRHAYLCRSSRTSRVCSRPTFIRLADYLRSSLRHFFQPTRQPAMIPEAPAPMTGKDLVPEQVLRGAFNVGSQAFPGE